MGITDRIKKSLGMEKRNFRYLDKLINGGSKEIILDSDIVSDVKDSSKYASGIKINTDNIVIDGNGHIIEAHYSGIFQIISKNVTLKNITFKNGYADSGGAIFAFGGEIKIENCIFENNSAKRYGDAIYNDGGDMTLDKTVFRNNSYGNEVIDNRGGNIRINGCEFSNNSSILIDNNGHLNIENGVFKNNKSKFLIVNRKESNLTIIRSKMFENRLTKHVVFNEGGNVFLKNAMFDNSLATSQYNVFNEGHLTLNDIDIRNMNNWIMNRGEIYIKFSKEEYSFDEIKDNVINVLSPSDEVKYVIENYGSIETNSIPKEEKKDDFTYLDNLIHESGEKEIFLHSNISLKNYEMEFFEGGIELDIDDMIIHGNGHIIDGCGRSRIFLVSGKNIALKGVVLKNGNVEKSYYNTPNNNGGAIRVTRTGDLTIDLCTFANNRSKNFGGAISNCGTIAMSSNTLNENRSDRGGAINNQGTIAMFSDTLNENISKYGGAINNFGAMDIHDTNLNKNTSWSGGAIYNEGTITFKRSTITDNDSRSSGGGVYSKGKIEMDGTVLKGNKSDHGGGGALCCEAENAECEMSVSNCEMENNESDSGGAVCLINGSMTITSSIFNGNHASWGGAIKNWKNLILDDCRLMENHADDGGALQNNRNVEIKGSVINGNVGEKSGGAISNSGEMLIDNSEINENSSRKGGSIFNDKNGKLEVRNSKLNNNTIYLSKGKNPNSIVETFTDDGMIIASGKVPSTWEVGAIYSLSSKKHLKIINCEYKDTKLD